MSKLRHVEICPAQPAAVTTLAYEFKDGFRIAPHMHPEDQLVYASAGVMTVQTDSGIWVVPPHRALWLPARTAHAVLTSGHVSMRTIYFRARMIRSLPRTCRVINVAPLLRELIVKACTAPVLTRKKKAQAHLIDIIIDQLEDVESVPLQLPAPADPRAARVADALIEEPADRRTIDQICREAGASRRTIERLFQLETAMSLGEWRKQCRLLRSLRLLAAGEPVTRVAHEVGYSTPSAFISMFHRAFGETPRRYFA